MAMRFSFLMCVNKKLPFLAAAIDSVLDQTVDDFHFYIIANNCDDELWEFLQSYQDSRLKIHRTLVGQLSFNLNFGLNLIGGGYVLRMDADDICLPDRLEFTRTYLAKMDYPDVLGGAAILIDERDAEVGRLSVAQTNSEIRSLLWRKCPMVHPTCAMNVESVLALRGYLGGFMSEDYDLWLRASRDPKFVFCNTARPLIKYRVSGAQTRGHALGYSEVAGHMLREFLIGGSRKFFVATILALVKRYFRAKKFEPT